MLRHYLYLPKTVHLLCAGTFINRAGTFIVPFLTIYMRDALGTSDAFAPVAMGVFGLGSICGSIAGGHLADRIGRRPVMLAALLGSALMLLVLSRITSPAAFLAGIFGFALIADTYRPAASAMIADLTTPEQRSHAFALMYVSVNLGFAIGPVVGGTLAEYSFRWLFYGDAATTAVYAVMVLLGVRETLGRLVGVHPPAGAFPVIETDGPADTTTAHVAVAAGIPARTQVSFATAFSHMLSNATFLTLCAASFCVAVIWMQSMSTFPLYLKSLGFGPATYGRIIAVNGVLIVLGQLPLTHWMQGRPRGRWLIVAALLTSLGFGLQAAAHEPWGFAAAVAIWTLGEMMQQPLLPPIVAELAPAEMRARYMGFFGMCFSGANMLGAPLGGLVLSHAGATVLWIGGAGLALVSAVLYTRIALQIAEPRVSLYRSEPNLTDDAP